MNCLTFCWWSWVCLSNSSRIRISVSYCVLSSDCSWCNWWRMSLISSRVIPLIVVLFALVVTITLDSNVDHWSYQSKRNSSGWLMQQRMMFQSLVQQSLQDYCPWDCAIDSLLLCWLLWLSWLPGVCFLELCNLNRISCINKYRSQNNINALDVWIVILPHLQTSTTHLTLSLRINPCGDRFELWIESAIHKVELNLLAECGAVWTVNRKELHVSPVLLKQQ